jgi:transposase-like protein
MSTKRVGANGNIRYSEAFKMQIVREVEENDLPFERVRRKYGIKGAGTVQCWVFKYGNGTRGKVIRVQTPQERDELKELKKRIRQLESALADAHIDAAIERAYTEMACERAGIADVAGFKKKAAVKPGTGQ